MTAEIILPERLHGPIAIDTETNDPLLKKRGPGWCFGDQGGHVAGISISCDNVQRLYVPVGHEQQEENADPELVRRWLQDQLADDTQPKIFANANYDIGWLQHFGVETHGPVHDVLVQASLLNEHRKHFDLDGVGLEELGIGKDYTELMEFGRQMKLRSKSAVMGSLWRFPVEKMRSYAEQDAELTLKLWRHFQPQIEDEELEQVYQLERDLLPVLRAMRWRGVRVDLDKAEQVMRELQEVENNALAEIKHKTGVTISSTDSKSAGPALRAIGIDVPKTPKSGQDSVTKDYLETLPGEVPELIRKCRRARKAWADFVQSSIMEHHYKGRIHAEFLSVKGESGGGVGGTVGGRFSSRNPNLQQIPARDPEIGPLIRGLYLPEPGELWGSADYKSQEPRMTVHYAVLAGARKGQQVADQYNSDPDTDYHQLVADLCGIKRKQAKTINLGLAYGMGGAALCHGLGLPTEWVFSKRRQDKIEVPGPEGEAILEAYHENVPYIRQLSRWTSKAARERGYVRTLSGRKCRFPLVGGERYFTHKSLNRIIQGSSADQMKYAMIELHRKGKTPLITVHDEVCMSGPDQPYFDAVSDIMQNVIQLSVPFPVDLAIGPNWGATLED